MKKVLFYLALGLTLGIWTGCSNPVEGPGPGPQTNQTPVTYTLTFYPNDPRAAGTMTPVQVSDGQISTLPACGFTNPGFQFAGWAFSAGDSVALADQAKIPALTQDFKLYAKWTWKTYALGSQGPAGGLIFYINPSANLDGWKYLEAAPAATEVTSAQWGAYDRVTGASGTACGTGRSNTDLAVKKLESLVETGKAAQLCDNLTYNGFSDWFLPSKDELNAMYQNLKMQGLGGFPTGGASYFYWSSTESGNLTAWMQNFTGGMQNANVKDTSVGRRVRAARSF